ncbi:MAG: hypothetical protein CBE49_000445 [Rickettsiales bacterium TMED289]|nr:MAG: hypothetical protein CBE49_000445 [Rickettsiales bacterium TMED289]
MFVDYIGFNFDQNSKNKISIDNFKEIKNWINGPKIVAEFGDSSITHINEIMSKIEVDYLSINYSSETIKKIGKNCIINIPDKDIISQNPKLIKENINKIKLVIIEDFDDSMINSVKYEGIDVFIENKKSFLDTENKLKKYDLGLKLSGSNELRPGYKDYNTISDILDKISIPI